MSVGGASWSLRALELYVQVILDVFSQKVYVNPRGSEPITKENVLNFVNEYRNEELEGRPLTLPE